MAKEKISSIIIGSIIAGAIILFLLGVTNKTMTNLEEDIEDKEALNPIKQIQQNIGSEINKYLKANSLLNYLLILIAIILLILFILKKNRGKALEAIGNNATSNGGVTE